MQALAIDVGTSSVKAAVLDVASAAPIGPVVRIAYTLDHPTPDAAELPGERLWSAVVAAAREASERLDTVEGIGLSCLTPGLVLLDAADKPVGPIWTHLDRRARPVARKVWAEVGEEFLATTGNRPLPGGMSVLCYVHQVAMDPSLALRVKHYMHVNSWLGFCMTAERAFDPANASFTGLFGTMTDQSWSERWCRYFEVQSEWLPPVMCGSDTVGMLRPEAAAELGVRPGIPVKIGTADTSSAMLAADAEIGDLFHVVGTTQVLAALTVNPQPSPRRLTRRFGVGPAFVHVTHNPVGGAALGWLRDLCFRDQTEEDFYANTVPAAVERRTDIRLDPPFLGGDRLEIETHRAAFRELTLATDRLDLLAALLQTMRLQHRQALTDLGLGDRFRRTFLAGGGAEIVQRLVPEYAGASVRLLSEPSLCGVACLFTCA
jgi:xylulokinase